MKGTTDSLKVQIVEIGKMLHDKLSELAAATNIRQHHQLVAKAKEIVGAISPTETLNMKNALATKTTSVGGGFGSPDPRPGSGGKQKKSHAQPVTVKEEKKDTKAPSRKERLKNSGINTESTTVVKHDLEIIKELASVKNVVSKYSLDQLKAICADAKIEAKNKSANQLAALLITHVASLTQFPVATASASASDKALFIEAVKQYNELIEEMKPEEIATNPDLLAAYKEIKELEAKIADKDFTYSIVELDAKIGIATKKENPPKGNGGKKDSADKKENKKTNKAEPAVVEPAKEETPVEPAVVEEPKAEETPAENEENTQA